MTSDEAEAVALGLAFPDLAASEPMAGQPPFGTIRRRCTEMMRVRREAAWREAASKPRNGPAVDIRLTTDLDGHLHLPFSVGHLTWHQVTS